MTKGQLKDCPLLLNNFMFKLFSGSKLILVMLIATAMLAGVFYWYFTWSQNELTVLKQDNAKLELAVEQQKQAIASLTAFQIRQNQQVNTLQTNLAKSESGRKLLEEKFLSHDLEYLARNKPALIERRINAATADVFKQIELDTGAVDNSVVITPPLADSNN